MQSSQCQDCNAGCKTCFGSASNQCLSCPADAVLANGACSAANCWNGAKALDGFGVCLESLVTIVSETKPSASLTKTSKTAIIIGSIVGTMLLLGLSFCIVRKHFKNKRKTKVQEFQDKKQIRQSAAGIFLQSMKDKRRQVLVRRRSVELVRTPSSEQRHNAMLGAISGPIIVRPPSPQSETGSAQITLSRSSYTAVRSIY